MNTKPTPPHTQDNNSDFEVSPDIPSLLTFKSEYAHTAGKRALSAHLLNSAINFEPPLESKTHLDHFNKLTTLMLTLDKSIREDAKYLEEKAKTETKASSNKDADYTRLRVLADLCDLTRDISPEDYDLNKLEAHLQEQEQKQERRRD